MTKLNNLSVVSAHELLRSKKVSCIDLVQYYLDRIKKYDSTIKACLTVCADQAIVQAKAVDEKVQAGEKIELLEGIPFAAKDMCLTAGVKTTAASKILQDFTPPYNATAIQKLEDAGAILIAKVNQDEFAHGGSTENSAFTKTVNPWDKTCVPGGSSGGSAAAVAADFCMFSLGTDTGGSIRQPASYCGVTGLKPTYGRVSRYGVIAMASSFDCIGPITRSAEDAKIVLKVIEGIDKKDSTTLSFQDQITKANPKIAVAAGYENHPQIVEAKKVFGNKLESVELPSGELALAAYYVLVPSEISSNLERYDGIRYGSNSSKAHDLVSVYSATRDEFFGAEVKRRIITGTYTLSTGYYDAYYNKAMKIRTILSRQYEDIFKKYDILLSPTTLAPAFKFGAKNDPVEMYKTDVLTVSANLAGIPSVSIPAGFENNLPLGLQISSKLGNDELVLQIAEKFQKETKWHTRSPKL